jgi:hypothetical protein
VSDARSVECPVSRNAKCEMSGFAKREMRNVRAPPDGRSRPGSPHAPGPPPEFTQSFKMKGGVMMSGGSYLCYNDPQDPTNPPGAMPIGSCQGCTEGGPSHCQDVRSTRNAPPATQASRPTAASAARGNFQSRTSPRTQPGTKTTRRCSSGRRPRPITTPISAPAGTTTRRWLRTGCPTRSSS